MYEQKRTRNEKVSIIRSFLERPIVDIRTL